MPPRMFSVEGTMGLRSWRYADGTAILRAVVAASSSIADGVASALKPRRTRMSPYPAAATARANRISKNAFQGFICLSRAGTTYQDLKFCSTVSDWLQLKNPNAALADVERRQPSSEIQGGDQPCRLPVSSSSARPNVGRYLPKFNSKSLGTP